MSDNQLYLAIGIPSLLVILNMFQSNRLFDKIDRLAEQQHKDVMMLMERILSLNGRLSKIGD